MSPTSSMAQANLDQAVGLRERERDEATSQNRRERGVGKLIEKVPGLVALRLTVAEARASGWQGRGYARYIDLERALALFEVPCSYAHCQGGGYDLTGEVLAGLRLQRASFEGRQTCAGRCGSVDCARILYFEAKATYAPAPSARAESPAFEPAAEASPVASRRMLWLTR
jgi:hypothetical protein